MPPVAPAFGDSSMLSHLPSESRKFIDRGPDNNTIRIVCMSDSHCGYVERDTIRGEDSFLALRECLSVARAVQADMILHSGNLFHDNKPSRSTMCKVIELLRGHCFGDRAVRLKLLSDPSDCLRNPTKFVNYEDPDVNVALPMFCVHGNRDDPSGHGGLSALHQLAASSLVNYLDATCDNSSITASPVLMSKGETKLALYGLGNLRDERLIQMMREGHVHFPRPSDATDSFFNLLAVHQKRGAPLENGLPPWMDFTLWGHEHESVAAAEVVGNHKVRIFQVGSGIATGMGASESLPKHCCVLDIRNTQHRVTAVPLKMVRPFLFSEIRLQDLRGLKKSEAAVEEALEKEIVKLLNKDADSTSRVEELQMPLVRFRVDCFGFGVELNARRFGQRFLDKVANPHDLLVCFRHRAGTEKVAADASEAAKEPAPLEHIGTLLRQVLNSVMSQKQPQLLPGSSFMDALQDFVDKDENNAISDFVDKSLASVQEEFYEKVPTSVAPEGEIDRLVEARGKNLEESRSVDAACEHIGAGGADLEEILRSTVKSIEKSDALDSTDVLGTSSEIPKKPTRQTGAASKRKRPTATTSRVGKLQLSTLTTDEAPAPSLSPAKGPPRKRAKAVELSDSSESEEYRPQSNSRAARYKARQQQMQETVPSQSQPAASASSQATGTRARRAWGKRK